jgi:hypothetical protein
MGCGFRKDICPAFLENLSDDLADLISVHDLRGREVAHVVIADAKHQ